MNVDRTRHIDAGEPDESGKYDYYYEYDLYRFTQSGLCLVARSYTSEPESAHFLRFETASDSRPLARGDLSSPIVRAAREFLLREGKVVLSWLSSEAGGYAPLQAEQHGHGA